MHLLTQLIYNYCTIFENDSVRGDRDFMLPRGPTSAQFKDAVCICDGIENCAYTSQGVLQHDCGSVLKMHMLGLRFSIFPSVSTSDSTNCLIGFT